MQKQKVLKPVREKFRVTYIGKLIRITADFSTENLNTKRAWNYVFRALKENNCKSRLLYSGKLSFVIEGESYLS
jgi:hypothetical protein